MNVTSSNMTIAQLVKGVDEGAIVVDHDYQRSLNWPPAARSFLIDTILSGYPLPKLSLSQTTDLKTLKTTQAIVDGQQRTQAIVDFLKNKLRVSTKTSAYLGKTFNQLEDEEKQKFLGYVVNIDLFTGASDIDVREVFKRMNWYTAPANDQEKRHSRFTGEFKQFISELSNIYSPIFELTKTFNKRQISRMADTEFLTECAYTYLNGIDHGSQAKLDRVYEEKEIAFPEQAVVSAAFSKAFQYISSWPFIFDSNITKTYNLYSLTTVCMHLSVPSSALSDYPAKELLPSEVIQDNLIRMNGGLDKESKLAEMIPFAYACAGATNRLERRKIRFQYFMVALTTGDFETLGRSIMPTIEASAKQDAS